MHSDLFLGIDIGSVSIKTALIDAHAGLLSETYTRIKGDPLSSLEQELASLASRFSLAAVRTAGITGSGGKQAAALIGARFVNEILAQARFDDTAVGLQQLPQGIAVAGHDARHDRGIADTGWFVGLLEGLRHLGTR